MIIPSEDVHRLLADLLQLVLHTDNELLDAGVVGFGAGRVDLAAHLLNDEAKLAVFRVNSRIAKGVAIGTCSHAVGTTKALEMGELEGAMSGVSIAVSGLLTTAIVVIAGCFV